MHIAHINIRRGLCTKILQIETYLIANRIDILGISEADINPMHIPEIEGYYIFTSQACDDKRKRVIVYIKDSIPANKVIIEAEIPNVVFKLNYFTVAIIYSEFASHGIKMKQRERITRLLNTLDLISKSSKRICILGDINIHYEKPENTNTKKAIKMDDKDELHSNPNE